jgi:predicted branched-subunit amino acid permease
MYFCNDFHFVFDREIDSQRYNRWMSSTIFPQESNSPRIEFIEGLKAILPILPGVVPFAMIAGIAAVDIGLTPIEGAGMSLIVYAGAAQLAGLQLIGAGASPLVIFFTAWVINLRFMLYSASLGKHFTHLPLKWKIPLAYILSDQAYAATILNLEEQTNQANKHWRFFGAAILMWATYQAGTILGVILGAGIPESWSLDFALPLTFLALAVPTLKDRPAIFAGLLAGVIATFGAGLPYNLGLPIAVVIGIITGMFLEERKA